MRNCVALLTFALATAASASPASDAQTARSEAELARMLAGRVEGKRVSCIPQALQGPTRIIDGIAIVYEYGRTLYVNRPALGCTGLRRDNTIVTHTFGSKLCRGDIARFVDAPSGVEEGLCGLSDFVPYTKPKR